MEKWNIVGLVIILLIAMWAVFNIASEYTAQEVECKMCVEIYGNTVFIDGRGYSVASEYQGKFIEQQQDLGG